MKYLLILSLGVISFFAFSSGENTPALFVNHDKEAHASAFFLLSFLLHRSFKTISIYKIMMLAMSLGVAIEVIQILFTSRGFHVEDLIYDAVGIAMYCIIYLLIYLLQSKKEKI